MLFVASNKKHQAGAVLVIGLMLLLAMSFLAIAATSNVLITTRLANNLSDKEASFRIADNTLNFVLDSDECRAIAAQENNQGLNQNCPLPSSFTNNSTVSATIMARGKPIDGDSLGKSIYQFEASATATKGNSTTTLVKAISVITGGYQ